MYIFFLCGLQIYPAKRFAQLEFLVINFHITQSALKYYMQSIRQVYPRHSALNRNQNRYVNVREIRA